MRAWLVGWLGWDGMGLFRSVRGFGECFSGGMEYSKTDFQTGGPRTHGTWTWTVMEWLVLFSLYLRRFRLPRFLILGRWGDRRERWAYRLLGVSGDG